MKLEDLLNRVQAGEITPQQAKDAITASLYEDLGEIKWDNFRQESSGFGEVVFCQNKMEEQIISLASKFLAEQRKNVLFTNVNKEVLQKLKGLGDSVWTDELAKCAIVGYQPAPEREGYVLIVSAGTSDLPVAKEAAATARAMGSTVKELKDVGVSALHRLLRHVELLRNANVLVVAAGMGGALVSVISGLVAKPVIGLPTSVGYGVSQGGYATLLSILSAPANGVSVVNIDNGFGAGYQAALIDRLATKD